ncbi:hypothetical protein CDL15_Pgr017771 [Punica granatum]|uniref:Peptidyl-prolyl cis-trans isomerase n=1 Tax=Punica granatum TaxID=22663 RepID=A0A218WHA6_PUNGR|nr:hypothetical protein CDL15_Pgr017771 [Punica granatum]
MPPRRTVNQRRVVEEDELDQRIEQIIDTRLLVALERRLDVVVDRLAERMGALMEARQEVDSRGDRVPNPAAYLEDVEYDSYSEGDATMFSEEDPSYDAFVLAGGDGELEFDEQEEDGEGDDKGYDENRKFDEFKGNNVDLFAFAEYDEEAHSTAVVLGSIGDIPDAEIKPPDNVLFVCKLNPVTEDEDLHTVFSRFGTVLSAEIIRDCKTRGSLCYAFIEFETKESCEQAYFKMDNALIDDRRIHVDFSRSVAKLWSQFRRKDNKNSKGRGCFKCGALDHMARDCIRVPGNHQQPVNISLPPLNKNYGFAPGRRDSRRDMDDGRRVDEDYRRSRADDGDDNWHAGRKHRSRDRSERDEEGNGQHKKYSSGNDIRDNSDDDDSRANPLSIQGRMMRQKT